MQRRIDEEWEPRNRYASIELGEIQETIGFLLRAAWKDTSRQFNAFFREIDFTPALYTVMVLVDLNPGCGPGDLAKPMGITQNNLGPHIDELIERGYLKKATHPRDRRVKMLMLTESGKAELTKLRRRHKQYTRQIFDRLGKEDAAHLIRILSRFDAVPH